MTTEWTITKKWQNEGDTDTTWTTVDFLLDKTEAFTIDIPHFQPQSDDDIIIGITNRSISERRGRLGIKIEVPTE